MAAPDQNAYRDWYTTTIAGNIPWLSGGPNGQAEGLAWPAQFDAYVAQLVAARYCAFPDKAPTDALPHLGGDRQLYQGPSETNANFIIRLKTPWGNSPITVTAPGLPTVQTGGATSGWALAGTWLQLLEELYWGGFTGITIVQQNGLGYSLSGAPTAGADNHGLLVITTLDATTSAITSSVTPTRSIPAGTPWFWFDSNTDLCNRFAVISTAISSISTADAARLQKIIQTWRPNAICFGVFGITVGELWDFPVGLTWDGDSNPWDTVGASWAQLLGSF